MITASKNNQPVTNAIQEAKDRLKKVSLLNTTTNNNNKVSPPKEEQQPQQQEQERTLALISCKDNLDEIMNHIKKEGFTIINSKTIQFTVDQAQAFYVDHLTQNYYDKMTRWLSSGSNICALILEKEDAIKDWRFLMGPTTYKKARKSNPNSIRALFGKDASQNATHGSDSDASAKKEIEFIFGDNPSLTYQQESAISAHASTAGLHHHHYQQQQETPVIEDVEEKKQDDTVEKTEEVNNGATITPVSVSNGATTKEHITQNGIARQDQQSQIITPSNTDENGKSDINSTFDATQSLTPAASVKDEEEINVEDSKDTEKENNTLSEEIPLNDDTAKEETALNGDTVSEEEAPVNVESKKHDVPAKIELVKEEAPIEIDLIKEETPVEVEAIEERVLSNDKSTKEEAPVNVEVMKEDSETVKEENTATTNGTTPTTNDSAEEETAEKKEENNAIPTAPIESENIPPINNFGAMETKKNDESEEVITKNDKAKQVPAKKSPTKEVAPTEKPKLNKLPTTKKPTKEVKSETVVPSNSRIRPPSIKRGQNGNMVRNGEPPIGRAAASRPAGTTRIARLSPSATINIETPVEKKKTIATAAPKKPVTKISKNLPRVAMMSTPKQPPTTEEETEKKTPVAKKRVSSTRSFISRLTAPTVASANKKADSDATVTAASPTVARRATLPSKRNSLVRPTKSNSPSASKEVPTRNKQKKKTVTPQQQQQPDKEETAGRLVTMNSDEQQHQEEGASV